MHFFKNKRFLLLLILSFVNISRQKDNEANDESDSDIPNKESGFCPPVVGCPFETDADVIVNFRLYTRKNPDDGQMLNINDRLGLEKSNFDLTRPTKVLVHGFLNKHDSPINQKLKSTYLSNHDVNVLVASWGNGARTICYNWAVQRVEQVGARIGEFLDFLLHTEEDAWEKLTIVGHSLGAHISGFAGKHILNGKVGTIVGLDPAGPMFSVANETYRLHKDHATYVECIHTNWKCYGLKEPFCSADFYPNSGYEQPGCGFIGMNRCDHSRAIELFEESLEGNDFKARRCDEPVEFGDKGETLKFCTGDFAKMGGEPGNKGDDSVKGVYYLNTRDSTPFSFYGSDESEDETDVRGSALGSAMSLRVTLIFLAFVGIFVGALM